MASAAQRSTIDNSRTVLIWVFFLIYKGSGHEDFHWLQTAGFIILVFGTLYYNNILTSNCFRNASEGGGEKKELKKEDREDYGTNQ